MAVHLDTGALGEQLACRWLEARGMQVLHRNWRHGRHELDIVARDGAFLVVVEVKTLRDDRWKDPEQAVDLAKQRKLMRGAQALLDTLTDDPELRFDVIAITLRPEGPQILHIPDAFYPTLHARP